MVNKFDNTEYLTALKNSGIVLACNVCGSPELIPHRGGVDVLCGACNAYSRTRATKFILDYLNVLKPNARVMHLSPEPGLFRYISNKVGDGYQAFDLDPNRYAFANATKLDLVHDCESLPRNEYDLILHSHVFEHLPCNYTAVLFHLHRSLKPDGVHVMVLPFMPGHYDEYLGTLPNQQATARFGQYDHCRWFGANDLGVTVGMIFSLPETYDLTAYADSESLDRAAIPAVYRSGYTTSSVLVCRKHDLLLT